MKDVERIGRAELIALLGQTTRERDEALAALRDILRVVRLAPNSLFSEEALGVIEALGKVSQ